MLSLGAVYALAMVAPCSASDLTRVRTVFLIVMENVNWSAIKGSGSAPYLNATLLPMASHADQYYTPAGVASSLIDYLWLEGGTNFGINDSAEPRVHTIASTNHLVTLLKNAGISWKSYQEDINGATCPLANSGLYAAYHNPFVYFEDIISDSTYCIQHIRPYSELASDLQSNTVARFNFITPNLCHDMHNSSGCATSDRIKNGDDWLAAEVPRILNSKAYQNDGALFITWDEGTPPTVSGPIGMIVISKLAKGGGYSNQPRYTHGSTRPPFQVIFGLQPVLFGAPTAPSLSVLLSTSASQLAIEEALITSRSLQFALVGT